MAVAVFLYFVVGAALGCAWNRAEFGRVAFRRTASSLAAFMLAWPCLVACAVVVAAIWTRIWRRAHDADTKPAPPRDRSAPLPPFAQPSHPV